MIREYVETWQPKVGDRVRILLSAECPWAWCKHYPDGTEGVVAILSEDLIGHFEVEPASPEDGHRVFVIVGTDADGRNDCGWYAVAELEPLSAATDDDGGKAADDER